MPITTVSPTENRLRLIGIKTIYGDSDPTTSIGSDMGIPTLYINNSSKDAFLLTSTDPVTWVDVGAISFGKNVLSILDASDAPPGTPGTGDAYLLDSTTTINAGWVTAGATYDDRVEWTGSSWLVQSPSQGDITYVNDVTNFYIYDGSDWILLSGSISAITYVSSAVMPKTTDNSYTVPTVWTDTTAKESYILSDVTGSVATWLKLGGNTLGDAQDSVLSIATSTSAPPTETTGDRYILSSDGAPHADWDGAAQADIVEFDGGVWVARTPTEGTFCEVEDVDTVYIFITAWEKLFQATGATFTTDSGNAVPNATGVLTVAGTSAQGLTTSGASNTVTFTISDASVTQKGVSELATNAEVTAGADSARTVACSSLNQKLGAQTQYSVITGGGSTGNLEATSALTNGMLPIGSTGATPVAATLTAGEGINVTNAPGSITILGEDASDTNKGIASFDSGDFSVASGVVSLNTVLVPDGGSGRTSHTAYSVLCGGTTTTAAQQSVSGVGTSGQLLTSNGASSLPTWQNAPPATDVSDSTFRIQDNGDASKEIAFEASGITTATTRTITMPDQNVDLTPNTGTFQGVDATLTALAAYNTNGLLTQTAADTFTGRTLTGTDNQVNIANGDGVSGNPTFSLPQSIDTAATVQFAKLGLGTATVPHGSVGGGILAIDGTDSSSDGPHVQFTTATDDYPLLQILNYKHDDIELMFDSYFDGAANKSSDAGTNFRFRKHADSVKIDGDTGVAQGGTVSFVNYFAVNADGAVTMPLQPCFLARPSGDKNDVTGDGTEYTVVWNDEIFDQGGDFDGTSTLTAPVVARYLLNTNICCHDLLSGHTSSLAAITTSNRGQNHRWNPANMRDSGGFCAISFGSIFDMDAADTATSFIRITGSTKGVDIGGSGGTDYSSFSGGIFA